jgi:hypothetical protein
LNPWLARSTFASCVILPSNEYNNSHPCIQQGLLLVLVPMIVYIAKWLIVFVPNFAEKSPFLNPWLARRAFLAVLFSLQTSTTMAIHAYGKNCLLFC